MDLSTVDLKDTFVVTMQLSDELELKKSNPNVKLFHRHAQSPEIWDKLIEYSKKWLSDVSSSTLKIDNISMWEFIYDEFFEIPGGIFEQIYFLKTVLSFIEEIRPKKIEIRGHFQFDLGKTISALSKRYQFQFVNHSVLVKIKKKQHRKLGNKILFFERMLSGKISSLFYRRKFDTSFILTHGFMASKISTTISDLYVNKLHESLIKSNKKPFVISLNLPRNHRYVLHDVMCDFINVMRGHYRPLSAYVPWGYFTRKNLSKEYQNLIKNFIRDSCANFSIDDVQILPLIDDKIEQYLTRRIQDVIVNIEICRRYLQRELPTRVLNIEGSNLFGKALTLACNEKGVKVFAIQLGIISKELPANSSFFIQKNYNQQLVPPIFVWGKYYKDLLLERGYPESKIIETGFFRESENKKTSQLNFEKYILYVASANVSFGTFIGTIDEELTTIKEISKAVPKDIRIIVKLHPTLLPEPYKKNLNEANVTIIDNFKYSTEDLVSNAYAVVGKCSTLLLESLLHGKKVIWVNFSSGIDFCGLVSESILKSPESFEQHFKNIGNIVGNLREDLLSSRGEVSRGTLVRKFYED